MANHGMDGLAHSPDPGRQRLAFVMPVVNPRNDKVTDYATVLRVLRETLRSLTSQLHQDILVVVVCHGAPDWVRDLDDRVRFVDVGDHPAFAPNRNHVRVDKGMKYALGCLYAIGTASADLVMLTDADDFIRTDLGQRLFALLPSVGETDGFLVRRGLELRMAPGPDGLLLGAGFEIDAFNRGCGSCRIFRAAALAARFRKLDPAFFDHAPSLVAGDDPHVIRPTPVLLDYIDGLTDPIRDDESGLIRILGRHTRQAAHFRLTPLDEPLAAKTCGHGNHDSGHKGDILHWGRIRRVMDPQETLTRFGLASSPGISTDPDTVAVRRGRRWIAANRVRNAFRRLLPPRTKY